MGIYEDLQRDIGEAFNTDLADATRTIQFTTYTDTYDEVTMINTVVETDVSVRAVLTSDFEGERVDDTTLTNNIKIIVLDSDRNNVSFEVDMVIKDSAETYKLIAFNPDPAKASWTIYARRLG